MVKKEELKLDDTVKQNSKGEVILGRLTGPCADFINPTRNGRQYDEALWEKVFNDPIINEYFEAGGIPGELDHPTDRLETCSEKIAIMMPEKPKKNKEGQLVASFDILDTPNGRIAYTLAKYGYKLGISSRGNGDTYDDYDGKEHVDKDTYDFQAFDLVLLPAVKAARLKMVESLQNGTNNSFSTALCEALERSNPDEKKIMRETLDHLGININQPNKEEYNHESVIDKHRESVAAQNIGATVVKELQETLLANQKAEEKIAELQERLSVCYTKEAKDQEDISRYKETIKNLSENLSKTKALQTRFKDLEEELKTKDSKIREKEEKNEDLIEKLKSSHQTKSNLREAIETKRSQLNSRNDEIIQLREKIKVLTERLNHEKNNLDENLAEMKKNLTIKTASYNSKLSEMLTLVEKYKKTAKTAVNKYIDSQALRLGIMKEDIMKKLPENYSFNDIDRICEQIGNFSLNVSNLPFNIDIKNTAVLKESNEKAIINTNPKVDDTIDDLLLTMANL